VKKAFTNPLSRLRERGRGEGSVTDSEILDNAKTMRSHLTESEQRLWYYLRAHRFINLKFKRQKPMGCYIVDFVCEEQRLIVEVDGGQHVEQLEYDQRRDTWLRS
jgi:very-short-patch-repair endonuclease